MTSPPSERSERLLQLQELAKDDRRDFPTLDADAWDTALADLDASERRSARRRKLGWVVVGLVIVVAAVLVVSGLY